MASIDYAKLHEVECVSIALPKPILTSSLSRCLVDLGGKVIDDFVEFFRCDPVLSWQSETFAGVSFSLNGIELAHYFDSDEPIPECDQLNLSCPFASIPIQQTTRFLELVSDLHQQLGGKVFHYGVLIPSDTISSMFRGYAEDIETELAEVPGSELLTMIIEEAYQRPNYKQNTTLDTNA
jgi:hypothetical protein